MADLSTYNIGYMTHKEEYLYFLVLEKKSLPTPDLEDIK